MKKSAFLLLACLLLACASCIPLDNHDYPSKVTFSKKGGEKIVYGTESIGDIVINDYNATVSGHSNYYTDAQETDTLCVTCEWLTIKQPLGSNKLILIAEPNTTKKKRRLYTHMDFGPTRGEIIVKQSK